MSFLQRFLRNFDLRPQADGVRRNFEVIDHGDPRSMQITAPVLRGPVAVKPPASLERFASHYDCHPAPNGEGMVDVPATRYILRSIMPIEEWDRLAKSAYTDHESLGPLDYDA